MCHSTWVDILGDCRRGWLGVFSPPSVKLSTIKALAAMPQTSVPAVEPQVLETTVGHADAASSIKSKL
jgi:hypothetical protein